MNTKKKVSLPKYRWEVGNDILMKINETKPQKQKKKEHKILKPHIFRLNPLFHHPTIATLASLYVNAQALTILSILKEMTVLQCKHTLGMWVYGVLLCVSQK